MNKSNYKPKELTLMGLLTAVLLVMSFTPLGYLNIGPLAITLNMIPVAIGAIALGPKGGAFLGAVFGITSVLQCIGIGGSSPMGVILFEISPLLCIIQRFVPRFIMGLLTAYIHKAISKTAARGTAPFVAGFSAAFLNTVLFMSLLILLFGNTEYLTELMGGKNVLVFICTFVGVNAIFEMIASTVFTGIIAKALIRARLIKRSDR